MAQIAIPLLLVGTAYLVCNDNTEKEEQEGFSEIKELSNQGNLLADESKFFSPQTSSTSLNTNNEETLSSHQDKYYLNSNHIQMGTNQDQSKVFHNLAGEQIKYSDINHNNMNVFYKTRSNGVKTGDYDNILDNYTGQGTFDIRKQEIQSFFKQDNNLQNIFGSQNQNDFYQSRTTTSMRRANDKPFESIKDTPGVGLEYGQNSDYGFNTGTIQRDLWKPKTVDELRVENNPKLVYRLDDHMGPAMQKVQNMGIQGKVVKRTPESFFKNDNNLGMIAGSVSGKQQIVRSEQELNEQNRDTTSVSYYGAKGPGEEHVSYVNGEYQDPHKQQLPSTPFVNFSNNNLNPTNELNYSKSSYEVLPNNRSTTRSNYFGSVGNMISNVVQPIVNGLRHTKKTNFVKNKDMMGNVSGVTMKQQAVNPYDNLPTTNREMYDDKLGMNHLNVQKQDATAYMNTRPILEKTQRSTMNQSETGPAMTTNAHGNKSYHNVYNQRNNNRLYAEEIQSGGNMNLFNSNISMRSANKESCNNRATPFYNPQKASAYEHPTELIGKCSTMPQEYSSESSNYVDESLLTAFKQNPYTQPLNSIA